MAESGRLRGSARRAFAELPQALEAGATASGRPGCSVDAGARGRGRDRDSGALLDALRGGTPLYRSPRAVAFAAAARIARFPTSNEFGDWDTALHSFTFANAVEQGLRRSPSLELVRGILDACEDSLPRFLNVRALAKPSRDGIGPVSSASSSYCWTSRSGSTRRRARRRLLRRRRRSR